MRNHKKVQVMNKYIRFAAMKRLNHTVHYEWLAKYLFDTID